MLHLKNHPLARRETLHRFLNVAAQLLAEQVPFRIRRGAQFRLPVEEIAGATLGFFRDWRLILAMAGPAAKVVERYVRHHAVQPSVKAAFKPKAVQVPVNPQKTFLIDVAGIFGAMNEIPCQAQDVAIVSADQVLERQAVTRLGLTDECLLLRAL